MSLEDMSLEERPMNSKELREFILGISGVGVDGKTKVEIGLEHEKGFSDGNTEPVDEAYICKPIVEMYYGEEFCTVDFLFELAQDQDLMRFWDFLENFKKPENSFAYSNHEVGEKQDVDGNPLCLHLFTMSLLIKEYRGERAVHFKNFPFFYQMVSKRPGTEANILRMVFPSNDVIFEMYDKEEVKEWHQEGMYTE